MPSDCVCSHFSHKGRILLIPSIDRLLHLYVCIARLLRKIKYYPWHHDTKWRQPNECYLVNATMHPCECSQVKTTKGLKLVSLPAHYTVVDKVNPGNSRKNSHTLRLTFLCRDMSLQSAFSFWYKLIVCWIHKQKCTKCINHQPMYLEEAKWQFLGIYKYFNIWTVF